MMDEDEGLLMSIVSEYHGWNRAVGGDCIIGK